MSSARSSPRDGIAVAFNEHVVAIYDGRQLLGEILIGRTIRASDAAGNELGTYPDRDEATKAIIRAAAVGAGSET